MVVVVENLYEPTQIDGVGDKVNEEDIGIDTDVVSKLGTLNNNETDEVGTKTGDNDNNTAIGVKMVVGVEGARYNISVITNDWIERESALLGYQ